MKVPGVRPREFQVLAERSVRNFARHDMAVYAMALAYRGLLALLPFTLFLVSMLGLLRADAILAWLAEQGPSGLRWQFPEPVVNWLTEQLHGQEAGDFLSVGLLVTFWSVSMGAQLLTKALNIVFEVDETRPAWKRFASYIIVAPVLTLVGSVAVALMLVTSRALTWFSWWANLGGSFVFLWGLLRVPVALVLLALVVSIVYRYVPSANLLFRAVAPGAALAVVLWALASLAFSLFLSITPDYGAAYGSLGAAISLVLYLYISAAVVLLGAEVNAAMQGQDPAKGAADEEISQSPGEL